MSLLRARCPECRTLTAVAVGEGYECHSCGATFGAGLVRVPRAWGRGGEAIGQAALLPLPYPEAAIVEEQTLTEQNLALACALPERPIVLGGCCCAHVGAVEGLATRHERLAVVWLDAHGDLNTPETSPSGNPWGMALRTLLDAGTIAPDDVALVGARSLDPPEEAFIAESGLNLGDTGVAAALDEADAVYVAVDCDVFDPAEDVAVFMPEPGGLTVGDAAALLERVAADKRVAGAGFTSLVPHGDNGPVVTRLCAALGL